MKEENGRKNGKEPDTHCYSKPFKKYELVMLDLHLEEGHKHPGRHQSRHHSLCGELESRREVPCRGCHPFLLPNLLRTNNLW